MKADILVVDDEQEICELLKALLEDEGYHVKTANSAAQAAEIVGTDTPALTFCDISMPGRSGLELIYDLRCVGLPGAFVMLTAHDDRDRILQALRLGVLDYVIKPYRVSDLVRALPAWMEIGRRLQAIHLMDSPNATRLQEQLRMIELFRLANLPQAPNRAG